MNLASWIILGIVAAIVALAIKATFFKGKSRGGCCDAGDIEVMEKSGLLIQGEACSCGGPCAGCPMSGNCSAVAKNAVVPIVKEGKEV